MGARYYNPVEGRFTQVDSSGQDFYYNFAGNNPINFSDPSGLKTSDTFVAIGVTAGVVGSLCLTGGAIATISVFAAIADLPFGACATGAGIVGGLRAGVAYYNSQRGN